MGKIRDFIAAATPITTSDGREVFPGNAKERKAIKNGAKVDENGYLKK